MVVSLEEMGKRIGQRRRGLQLRQTALAGRLGISNNHLSALEHGKESPSLEVLVRLCNELRVTPDYLLMGAMYANQIPKNITDGLRLCTPEDVALVAALVQYLVERRQEKWNDDNYV